ncbi:MAG: iron ABC transporter permease, partial [Pseudomonadota bacterium]
MSGIGRRGRVLPVVGWAVALICLLPMVATVLAALVGGTDTVAHLLDTVLWRYTGNTLVLVLLVALGTFGIGAGAAWLVTMTRFPGVKIFEIALVLPLAFPAYVLAYAYTDLL